MADPDTGTVPFEGFDRALHAILGRATRAVSPTSLLLAYTDWLSHLMLSPAKQAHLVQKALRKAHRLGSYLPGAASGRAEPCIEPLEQDRRFRHPDWQRWPFNAIHQSFLLAQQWWYNATTEVRGVSRHNEDVVTFVTRQLLDIVSPSNFPLTNPEVLRRTLESGGLNLYQGCAELDRGLGADPGRPAAGRRRSVPARENGGGDTRQGGVPQPPDRAHPVLADDREGPSGTDPHRAGVDHEVLHPRPQPAQLAHQVPG